MSNVVGYKNRFGRVLAYSATLQKNVEKFKLTPIFDGDPEAAELREVIDVTPEKEETVEPKAKAKNQRSISIPKE